jgi:NSS family neurotransmitter:Na+ symporter
MATKFGSKIGLIAATVGSAVGLGNIWRFPAETQANGGAAFLLVYIICVLLLGIPVMLGEFAIGREGGTDAVGDYKRISPRTKWWIVGGTGLVASYMILCFYIVVAGWTLEYLVNSISGDLFAGISEGTATFDGKMQEYVSGDWKPILYTVLMIAINMIVLLCGVRKGIEKISNVLMPLLFVILVIFCAVALSLPGASEGVEFFLRPDFSKLDGGVVIDALGQAFFSLSLGMGILITYAAYFPRNTRLGRTATIVSLLDMVVAVMMGLIIFPAVTSFGMEGESLEGATLVFVTLPEVFTRMPGTQFWAVLFFMLLLLAALTSTISIAEVSVRFFQEDEPSRRGVHRAVAAAAVRFAEFTVDGEPVRIQDIRAVVLQPSRYGRYQHIAAVRVDGDVHLCRLVRTQGDDCRPAFQRFGGQKRGHAYRAVHNKMDSACGYRRHTSCTI